MEFAAVAQERRGRARKELVAGHAAISRAENPSSLRFCVLMERIRGETEKHAGREL